MTVNLFGIVSLEPSVLKHSPGEILAEISFSEVKVTIQHQMPRSGNNTDVKQ